LDGSYYIGEWKEDLKDGFGEETFEGARYAGSFIRGIKSGHGKLNLPNGTVYEGEFASNAFNGKGKIKWTQGDTYEGDWINSKMHGKGVFTWKDGRKYIGEYKEDQKEGFGAYYWNQKKYYEGFWKKGKREGVARICKPNKQNYFLFKNDEIEKEIDKNTFEETVENVKAFKVADAVQEKEREMNFISNGLKNGI
jgi:hypothetical protein